MQDNWPIVAALVIALIGLGLVGNEIIKSTKEASFYDKHPCLKKELIIVDVKPNSEPIYVERCLERRGIGMPADEGTFIHESTKRGN